jgi:hypothetical protein
MRWTYSRILGKKEFIKNLMQKLLGNRPLRRPEASETLCLKTAVSKLVILQPPKLSKNFLTLDSRISHFGSLHINIYRMWFLDYVLDIL